MDCSSNLQSAQRTSMHFCPLFCISVQWTKFREFSYDKHMCFITCSLHQMCSVPFPLFRFIKCFCIAWAERDVEGFKAMKADITFRFTSREYINERTINLKPVFLVIQGNAMHVAKVSAFALVQPWSRHKRIGCYRFATALALVCGVHQETSCGQVLALQCLSRFISHNSVS